MINPAIDTNVINFTCYVNKNAANTAKLITFVELGGLGAGS